MLHSEEEAEEVADGEDGRVVFGLAELAVYVGDAAELPVVAGLGEVGDEGVEAEGGEEVEGVLVDIIGDAEASHMEAIAPA